MMSQHTQSYKAMIEVVNAGRSIENFLNAIRKDRQAFFDAVEGLTDCVLALRPGGLKFKTDDLETEDFLSASRAEILTRIAALLNAKNDTDAFWFVGALGSVIAQHRNGRTFNVETPAPATPAPMRVEITAMPTRETTSSIKYDSEGNLKSTTQSERDAAPD